MKNIEIKQNHWGWYASIELTGLRKVKAWRYMTPTGWNCIAHYYKTEADAQEDVTKFSNTTPPPLTSDDYDLHDMGFDNEREYERRYAQHHWR